MLPSARPFDPVAVMDGHAVGEAFHELVPGDVHGVQAAEAALGHAEVDLAERALAYGPGLQRLQAAAASYTSTS
ncbi:hypothetical protein SMC26_16475 [Actinomadura fulvescens]